MSQGPLCPNLSQKVQKEVSQMANRNLPIAMLLGGLSVNLNHLKTENLLQMHFLEMPFSLCPFLFAKKVGRRSETEKIFLSVEFVDGHKILIEDPC